MRNLSTAVMASKETGDQAQGRETLVRQKPLTSEAGKPLELTLEYLVNPGPSEDL